MTVRKTAVILGFSEIFNYANKFGVGWNDANDLFFGNTFEYRSCDEVTYDPDHLKLTDEEISELDESFTKASYILGRFLLEEGLHESTVRVDAT